MSVTKASLLGDTFGSSASGTIPLGGIIMWNGSVAPTGWALCDGSNGTPNLLDRFIVGATNGGDNVYPGVGVGQTGGSPDAIVVSHFHTATSTVSDPGHSHTWQRQDAQNDVGQRPWPASNNDCILTTVNTGVSATGITVATTISTEGSSATNANLPPYYALAFIMRVS